MKHKDTYLRTPSHTLYCVSKLWNTMKLFKNFWRRLTPSKDVEQAEDYEKAFMESVYRMCYVIGLSRADRSIPYLLYTTMVNLSVAVVIVSEIFYTFEANLSMDEMISCLNVIIIQFITLWKYKTMRDHKELYKKLAKAMESPYFDVSTDRRRKIMEYWAKKHDTHFQMLFSLGTCTIIAWVTFPLIDDLDYNFMVDIYLPFNYCTIFRYVITYLIMTIAFIYTSYWVIMSDGIMQAHLHPVICQYAVLADCFENIIEDCAAEFEDTDLNKLMKNKTFVKRYLKRLRNLVEQHKYILNNTTKMKSILSGPMLGQLSTTGMLICMVAYQATTTIKENVGKFLMSLLYLGYVMYTFYLACASCEEITLQSRSIGEAAYFSGWEAGMSTVPGVKATIMMVISRSNKPLIFLAGGMYTMSLSSYTNLVKASYSAFTVLLRADNT